nr:reverse transcriptase domain-containing protein [Tanacetum cinerariifolium]
MSSDNAQSTVTYTSISFDSDGPSWGIPVINAGELLEMDPYEEVAQQGQVHRLSPAYVPDPMELDEHVPVYVPKPEHPEYHAPSDDDIQVNDDDEDLEEDPSEEHEPEDDDEDLEEDPNEEHEPEDEHTKEPSKGSGETEPFEEDEIAVTPPPPRHHRVRIYVRPQTPMAASTQALIDAFASGLSPFPLPPTSPTYDQVQLGRRAAMIYRRDNILEEDMPPQRRFVLTAPPPGYDVAESSATATTKAPRGQYNFVDTVKAGQGLNRSPGQDTQTIARAHDRAEDVGYVEALQASERRMMTSIEEVNLRVSYQAQVRRQESANFYTQLLDAQIDRRDIRLEIDVLRGQKIAYESKLHEVHQDYLSSEAQNRALLARLETLKTHMSRMEWQRQSAEDPAVTQMMRIYTLAAKARTDMVEEIDSSCWLTMPVTRKGTNDVMTPESIQAMINWAIKRNSTHTQDDASQSSGGGLRRPVQPARVCSYTDFMKCQPLNFKGNEGVVGLSQWLKKMESIFHISGCAAENQGTLKKKLTDKYCLKGEIKKLQIKLWNLKVKGNDVSAYTQCFQKLSLMWTKFLANETEKVDKYISGLPDNIHGNIMSVRPKTLDEAIKLANDLMDQKLYTYAKRQTESKRKFDNNNQAQQIPKRRNDERNRERAKDQIKKFYQIFKDMSFEISFADALMLMPKFASTLKALIENKEKLSEMARTLLNEHCSAVLLKKLPKKLGDPGKLLIPCDFPSMAECLALADLGASINLMPYYVWKRLSLSDLTPTCMALELADRSITSPVVIAEDVYVKVGSFHFPADFVVVDFDADPRVPLILGRSFLKTGKALIDVFEGELTLCVGKEAITFNLDQTSRYSANYSDMTAKRIDVIDVACEEYSHEVLGFFDTISSGNPTPFYDPIVSATSPTLTPFGKKGDILLLEVFLNDDPSPPPNQGNYMPEVRKELKSCEAHSEKSSVDEPHVAELKELPPYLEYAFLEGDDKLSVIIAKDLSVEEKTALITILKSYKRAIAWKLSDIKGINPEFCTHKILMEEDFEPALQHQRRVNPKIHDVIKQE